MVIVSETDTHKKDHLISEAFRSVVLKCLSEQRRLCIFEEVGWGGYFRNRSLGGRKKVVREKFVNNRKNAHFFTGVNQNKRGGWRGRGRRRKRKRGRGRRSSKRRRRTIPHSNIIISLPYDNFLKSVICLFVTGAIITLQRMPSK